MRKSILWIPLWLILGFNPLIAQIPQTLPLPGNSTLPSAPGPGGYQSGPLQISRMQVTPLQLKQIVLPSATSTGNIPSSNTNLPGGLLPGNTALPGGPSLPGGAFSGSLPAATSPVSQMTLPSSLPIPPVQSNNGLPVQMVPSQLPASIGPSQALAPSAVGLPRPQAQAPAVNVQTHEGTGSNAMTRPVAVEVSLPYPETRVTIDMGKVTLKRISNSWQIWAGSHLLKDVGDDEQSATDIIRLLRDLRPTTWCTIGSPQPVVEYGLTNDAPSLTGGFPKMVLAIDLRTVRVEAVKGVWCVRDSSSILFNFGLRKGEADQTVAVIQKYAFNRIGMLGKPGAPALTYFFAALESENAQPAAVNPLLAASMEANMEREGLLVPGVGYFGELVKIDPRKVVVRKQANDWVVTSGMEILGRFSANDRAAYEAARVIRECGFTEYCKVPLAGITFFLVNGRAPTNAPYFTQGRRFDLSGLKVHSTGKQWTIVENGRHLYTVSSAEEGEALIKLLRYFGFNQMCQIGVNSRNGFSFLAQSR